MAKSTFEDCHAIYRQTRTLTRAHRVILAGWIMEDAAEKPAKVSKERKRSAFKAGEETKT